jgi:gliding motility-associated-like protein
MPEVETTYTVTITDSNGCKQSDQVTVCIIDDPLSIFKAVNAITPNGDGFNDELEFPGLEAFETNRLVIYNRWGNVVYQKDGYQTDGFLFSGLRNGEELPADTYYYVLTFDEFVVKETLTIIRPN